MLPAVVLSSTAPGYLPSRPLHTEASTRLLDTEPRAQERSWASSVTSVALGWDLWGSAGDRGGCWCVEQFPPAQVLGAAWGGSPPSWRLQTAVCASVRGSMLQWVFLFHCLQFAFALAESRWPLHRNTQREKLRDSDLEKQRARFPLPQAAAISLGALRWTSLQASGHSKRLCLEASSPICGALHRSLVPPPLSISEVSRAARGCHFSSHSVDPCLLGLQEPTATPGLLHQPWARVWKPVF